MYRIFMIKKKGQEDAPNAPNRSALNLRCQKTNIKKDCCLMKQ